MSLYNAHQNRTVNFPIPKKTKNKTISIVQQPVADAGGNFLAIDAGDSGRHSDGVILKHSSFGKALFNNELPIPEPAVIGDKKFPYIFVDDEANPSHTEFVATISRPSFE
ncbi:hypothetical protein ElyMa_006988600 [Elysia marginata]|uniref:DDE Tnp4 domain-containing protein n=1 Tax=Elysia marginata TaxID=1093978 RepID=A0AAV4JMH2_9GAST|nr:hypothetical protein ElyMa_006988600 [Elysia marginata]